MVIAIEFWIILERTGLRAAIPNINSTIWDHKYSMYRQDWLHNLWGPVQIENAGPRGQNIKNFKILTAEH